MTDQTAPNTTGRRRISPIAITIALVVILILAFLAVASVATEVLWYQQLGFLSVFTTQWIATAAMFLVGFLGMAVPVFFAIDIAYRKRPVYARLTAQLDRYQELVEPLRRVIKWVLPAVIGLFAGVTAAASWERVLLWLNSSPVGTKDPEFGLDISFFMFDLPVWQGIVGFASAVVLICLIAGAVTSYLYGGIAFSGRDTRISKATRVQAAVLAGLYLLLQGVSLWLDQYRTLTDSSGRFTGATFAGAHAVIPGKQILAGIAIIIAILFLITAFTGRWRLPVIGTALFVVTALVIGVGYPWGVQTLQVKPDEKRLEAEYLGRNIQATRAAYGIDKVQTEYYDAKTTAEAGALRNDAVATSNIRIIDPAIVSPTFAQLEQSKQYYKFPSPLSVDRYTIDGKVEDTVSAVRDIDVSDQQGWYNQRLVYTHGYGLVAAYGNQRSPSGEPVFLESGIPTSGKLGTFEPRVYFGQNSPTYSIVGGKHDKPIEVDYPADAESNAESAESGKTGDAKANASKEQKGGQNLTTFSGDGGPKLDGLFTRLIYALKFQDMEILLSGSVVEGSQIMYDRDPSTRVQKVAPYLTLDTAPYASVVDGRVVWIVDGYTTSADYPYSQVSDMTNLKSDVHSQNSNELGKRVNYIRNSVKATVDAYDGSVKLYAWDDKDPVLQAWGKVYPGTLTSVSKMSGDLLSHVRYPSDMFKVQREMLATYHVTDPGAFYSAEDAWRTPDDPVAKTAQQQRTNTPSATSGAAAGVPETDSVTRQPPYYLTLSAGAKAAPTYSIYSTYIPKSRKENSREILTGYLAADANAGSTAGKVAEGYGTLKLLTLPKGDTIPGPGQVQNSFTTNSGVSSQLNLLRQGESQVLSGNLLTLPMGGGLLYVQPVYVKASSGTSFPTLQKVLVSFGDRIAFEDTLDAALDSLFGGNSGASAGDGDTPVQNDGGGTSGGSSSGKGSSGSGATGGSDSALQSALAQMKQAIADRDAAMKAGDWAAYGKADAQLKAALEAALKAEPKK